MSYATKHPQIGIVAYLVGLAEHAGKRYAFPGQETMRREMAARWSWQRCRRTVLYHLAALERDGWFVRRQRHRRGPNGIECHSSLYILKPKAFTALKRMLRGATRWGKQNIHYAKSAPREAVQASAGPRHVSKCRPPPD